MCKEHIKIGRNPETRAYFLFWFYLIQSGLPYQHAEKGMHYEGPSADALQNPSRLRNVRGKQERKGKSISCAMCQTSALDRKRKKKIAFGHTRLDTKPWTTWVQEGSLLRVEIVGMLLACDRHVANTGCNFSCRCGIRQFGSCTCTFTLTHTDT